MLFKLIKRKKIEFVGIEFIFQKKIEQYPYFHPVIKKVFD
jgi:hypothetical protein